MILEVNNLYFKNIIYLFIINVFVNVYNDNIYILLNIYKVQIKVIDIVIGDIFDELKK